MSLLRFYAQYDQPFQWQCRSSLLVPSSFVRMDRFPAVLISGIFAAQATFAEVVKIGRVADFRPAFFCLLDLKVYDRHIILLKHR
jgi:hypothetical protein